MGKKILMLTLILIVSAVATTSPQSSVVLLHNLNVDQIKKAQQLLIDAKSYEAEGKSVKAGKAQQEADAILRTIFRPGVILRSSEKCYYLGFGDKWWGAFRTSCYEKITFHQSLWITLNSSLLETLEDITHDDQFAGDVMVVADKLENKTYTTIGDPGTIDVFCTVISAKITKKKTAQQEND